MKANYPACLGFTLRYEGGKVDDPRDPGGRTNQGITQGTYAAWLAKQGQASRDVYAITPGDRDAIYQAGYWLPIKGDGLADGVDLAVFDFGVNAGPARALKVYAARTSRDAATVVKAVCAARLSLLHALATFKTFGRGWTARVAACEAQGVRMAEHARIGVPVDAPAVPQVATTLRTEAAAAAAKATRHKKAAAAATAASGAAGTTQAPATPALHLPWPALAILVVLVIAGVAVCLWRAGQQTARAQAYAAAAKPA